MRTVSFANPAVVDLINEKFVAVWNNHNPERSTRGVQASYTPGEIAAYPEGGGGNNLYTVVAAPDGTVVNSLKGYWSASTILEELHFSLGLTKDNSKERCLGRMRALDDQASKMIADHPEERGKRVKDSPFLRRVAALRLLALTHGSDAVPPEPGIEKVLATFTENSRVRVWV